MGKKHNQTTAKARTAATNSALATKLFISVRMRNSSNLERFQSLKLGTAVHKQTPNRLSQAEVVCTYKFFRVTFLIHDHTQYYVHSVRNTVKVQW